MESPKIVYKYYSNPAFCSQSEVVFAQKAVTKVYSPGRRMPPLGANSPRKAEISNRILRTDISDNPLRMSPAGSFRSDDPPALPPKPARFQRNFQRQSSMICKPTRTVRCRTRSEDLEMAQLKQKRISRYDSDECLDDRSKHRYEVIRDFDDIDYSPTKKRIVEARADEIEEYNVDGPDEHEMKELPTEIVKTVNGRTHRYAIVPSDDDDTPRKNVTFSPRMSQKNLIATQKLHELLSTPRKLKSYASQPSVRMSPRESPVTYTPKKMVSSTPTQGVTPSKSCANLSSSRTTSPISPKALKNLDYGAAEFSRGDVFVTSFRERSRERSFDVDRRGRESQRRDKTTAVISPRVASPQSTYSDDYKSISLKPPAGAGAGAASLAIAALMLALSGALTTGLSFYMMYNVGRRYYLDFGVLSGFTCFLLGLLGLRSRRNALLPNRNYISGYILLSSFSLLTSLGLLILLTAEPKPGSPLNDITSGAVCGVSILVLAIATVGAVSSYCCKRDPPDNRVGTSTWY